MQKQEEIEREYSSTAVVQCRWYWKVTTLSSMAGLQKSNVQVSFV
jgi:hypothetical protein